MPPRKTKAAAAASTPAAEKLTRSSRSKKASADDAPSTSAPPSDETAAALEPSIAEKAVGALVDGVGKAVNAVKHLGESVEALGEDVANHAAKAFDKMESAEVPTAAKVAHEVEVVAHAVAEGAAQTKDSSNKGKGKGKGKAQEVVQEEKEELVAAGPPVAAGEKKGTTTMEERQAKLKELRLKMSASSAANRKDLITEHQKLKTSAKELASLEKKKRLAEMLREQADAEESGVDLERNKNWEWSIEDNEKWEAKLAEKEAGKNIGFVDASDSANKSYTRLIKSIKPDLELYNRQKELALGLEEGTLTKNHSSTSAAGRALARVKPMTSEELYRDANSLGFADSRPSENAIDNMVGRLNEQLDRQTSRKRANEEDGDVTYINDANKHFNKKIMRYYDKYTAEIRANFERGTAL